MNTTCILVLDDGTQFVGASFGYPAPTTAELLIEGVAPKSIGEVVFNTAMSGYHEVLTDPSYMGQLVAMTYPHIGNYGCDPQWSEIGPRSGDEAGGLHEKEVDDEGRPATGGVAPAGFIVRSLYEGPVPDGRQTLHEFLYDNATPGITGVDTRALTLHLRDEGSRNGVLVRPTEGEHLTDVELARVRSVLAAFPQMEGRDLIGEVGSREMLVVNDGASPHIGLLDCGSKANIIRQLVGLGCKVTLLPSTADDAMVDSAGIDALFISNGPGDPAVLERQVALIKESIGKRPVLGICLGHQLIAEALGAATYKMKFGHHGVNHPVRDERTKRVFVTSQNHGFAVDEETLPDGCQVWFRNANDNSVEGLTLDRLNIRTTQFHPESAPGPYDSHWIFQAFLENLR